MSTLAERRDVFWKAKAKRFAKERDERARRHRETERELANMTGDRNGILKRFRVARRWARAWKTLAKMFWLRSRFLKREWGKSRERYKARIQALEETLRPFAARIEAAKRLIEIIRDHYGGGPMNEQIADGIRDLDALAADALEGPWEAHETRKMVSGETEWVVGAFIDHQHHVVTGHFNKAQAIAVRNALNGLAKEGRT